MEAALHGDAKGINKLIAAGEDVNAVDKNGWTTLMHAAATPNPHSVKALIAAGADVNAKMASGDTALMIATEHGDTESVKALIAAGAEVNAKTANGDTAFKVAHTNMNRAISALWSAQNIADFENIIAALIAAGARE